MATSRIVMPALLVGRLLASGTEVVAQTFTFEQSFPATTATVLEVTTERSKITVRAGKSEEVVVVGRVSVRVAWNSPRDAMALARAIAAQPPVEHTGDTVRLQIPSDARTRRAVTIAYEVQVPAGTRVMTQSESGATRVEGVRAAVSVRTQSSAITLVDLGETLIDTGSGAVSVDGAGPLCVTTSSSGIDVARVSGGLVVRTQSGRVTASLVSDGDVDVETGSSAITVTGVDGRFAASTQSGRVRVSGNPRLPWTVTTGSSAIEAEFRSGAAFTLDASLGSGSVQTQNLSVEGESDTRHIAGSLAWGGPVAQFTSRSGSIKLRSAGS
jgi:DUF4097 and DUF4098 domain-containing protein YvlB